MHVSIVETLFSPVFRVRIIRSQVWHLAFLDRKDPFGSSGIGEVLPCRQYWAGWDQCTDLMEGSFTCSWFSWTSNLEMKLDRKRPESCWVNHQLVWLNSLQSLWILQSWILCLPIKIIAKNINQVRKRLGRSLNSKRHDCNVSKAMLNSTNWVAYCINAYMHGIICINHDDHTVTETSLLFCRRTPMNLQEVFKQSFECFHYLLTYLIMEILLHLNLVILFSFPVETDVKTTTSSVVPGNTAPSPSSPTSPTADVTASDKETNNPHAIPRRHAPIEQLARQGSFRGFPALSQKMSPFKRQLSLRINELPSTVQRKTDFPMKNAGGAKFFCAKYYW